MTKEIMQSRVKEDMLCLLFPKYGKKKKKQSKTPRLCYLQKGEGNIWWGGGHINIGQR